MSVWDYDKWPSRSGEGWGDRAHHSAWDSIDFHVDLGCGKVSKGRIGIDRYPAPGVAIVADLDVDPALRFNSRQVGVSSIAVWAAATVPGEAAGFYDDDGSAVLRQGESLVPYPRGSEWRPSPRG